MPLLFWYLPFIILSGVYDSAMGSEGGDMVPAKD
jgi:hypothetical protein